MPQRENCGARKRRILACNSVKSMKTNGIKTISRILILAMLHLCWLTSYGWAEIIPTESAIEQSLTSNTDRQRLLDLLGRQEMVDELERYGISKVEATARVNSLTDDEVTEIAGKLDELPPGGIVKEFVSILTNLILLPFTTIWAFICLYVYPWGTSLRPEGYEKKGEFCAEPMVNNIAGIFGLSMVGHGSSGIGGGTEVTFDNTGEYHGPSSKEMQTEAQCFSRCNSIAYECINSEKIEKNEPQCEEEKQACFQQCDNEVKEGKE